MTINAHDVSFGIEIECTVPQAAWGDRPIGGYHNGIQVADLPAGWKAERDGSISAGSGYTAVEIVSPVLRGSEGLQQVKQVVEWLNSLNAKVNASCGLHVTLSFPHNDIHSLRRLIHFVARHENAIFATTGSKQRQQNHYCSGIRESFRSLQNARTPQALASNYASSDRYHMLNLTHIKNGRDRVEFRAFAGTLNFTKLAGYIQLCVGIATKAQNDTDTSKWDREPVKDESRGAGKKAVFCMLRSLKWSASKGTGIGVMDPGLLKAVRSEFDRLARKYDGNEWTPKSRRTLSR
jgi:hypothetical protein